MEDEIQAGEDGFYCVGFRNVFMLNRAQVHETFSQYGSICSIRGAVDSDEHQGRNWAFVRFGNPEEAVRAITGMRASPHLCNVNYVKYIQDGRRGKEREAPTPAPGSGVSPLVRGDDPPEQPPVERPQRTQRGSGQFEVYVGNWPLALEEDDLYGLFAKFNIEALSVRLYKKEERSYAFVVVSSAEDVARAIEQLNRGKVAGRQIVVKDSRNSFAKHQSPAPQKSQQQQQQEPPRQPRQQPRQEREQPQRHQQQQQHERQQQQQEGQRREQQHREQQQPRRQQQRQQHYEQRPQQPAALAGRAQSDVRQRLGGPDWRGAGRGRGVGGAGPMPRPQPDISEMPPLVLPPPEPQPPPLAAPYRAPGGYPRPGGAGEPYNANGPPVGQFNGAGGRPAPRDIRFDREPAPRDVRFDREPAPRDIRFEREPAPRDIRFEREPAPGRFERELDYERGPEHPRGPFDGSELGRPRGLPRPSPAGLSRPPPAGPPPMSGIGARRSYNQRPDAEADFSEPFVKRPRFGEPEPGGLGRLPPGGLPPLGGLAGPPVRPLSMQPHRVADGPPPVPLALRSSVAISERIKSRLHAPMDVVVANFPVGTNEHDLMQLFDRFEPLNVRIMVNNSSQHPDDFTYAYITLSSRMTADEAVMEMDGLAFHGRTLVVETRKN